MTEEKMIAVPDAIAELGVSRNAFYRALASRGIETFKKLGDKRAFIKAEDLEALKGYASKKGAA